MTFDTPNPKQVKKWDDLLKSRHASSVAVGLAAATYAIYVYYGGAAHWTALAFGLAVLLLLVPTINAIK